MTSYHRHLQLHLFEPARDRTATSPEIRDRLRPLMITLLDEAARGAQPATEPNPSTEAGDE
jgi:hypothetical protein